MRAVVQRVLSASVTGSTLFSLIVVYALVEECLVSVNSEIVSEISRGLMVLVGIGVGKCHFNINIRRVVMK
jgi:D-Tyr-tRNAtyr deacylase